MDLGTLGRSRKRQKISRKTLKNPIFRTKVSMKVRKDRMSKRKKG
jgi:hypothetical protein